MRVPKIKVIPLLTWCVFEVLIEMLGYLMITVQRWFLIQMPVKLVI